MKIRFTISLLLFIATWTAASDLIFKSRVGTTLNKAALYPDSTYASSTQTTYPLGTLFEVIGETTLEHEDDSQNQRFKWYKVKGPDQKTGWIFGDELAVIADDEVVDHELKTIHKFRQRFDNGFERSVCWVAIVQGRDNFHKRNMLNPLYSEKYIVITNDRGRSVYIRYGGQSTAGERKVVSADFYDASGDDYPEIFLQTISTAVGSPVKNKSLEVYAFKAGTMSKVLEERMSLTYSDDVPSPAWSKYIEIDGDLIRVEYIDYINCNRYSLDHAYDGTNDDQEKCMEFVTYTYIWNKRSKTYKKFYDESRMAPKVTAKSNSLRLSTTPTGGQWKRIDVPTNTTLNVIKHYEKSVIENGRKVNRNFFYLSAGTGIKGYVSAEAVQFTGTQHTDLLNRYYRNPPASKANWKSNDQFLKIIATQDSSAASGR